MSLVVFQIILQTISTTLEWVGFSTGIRASKSPSSRQWAWIIGSAAIFAAWFIGMVLLASVNVEPVGQGDADKPRHYPYSTIERADLVEALWRHHDVRRTVVFTFDYTSLALLELLRRQLERTRSGQAATPTVVAALIVNGGLFADAHTHPWQTTPLRRTPLGALGTWAAQRSPRWFDRTMLQARLYSRTYHPTAEQLAELRSAITRRDGAEFLHRGAGFVAEHHRNARRWDFADIARELDGAVAFYVGGGDEDPYEYRQIQATRERVPGAEILTFPGGHLTTTEHTDLLAASIRDVARRHGVGSTLDSVQRRRRQRRKTPLTAGCCLRFASVSGTTCWLAREHSAVGMSHRGRCWCVITASTTESATRERRNYHSCELCRRAID